MKFSYIVPAFLLTFTLLFISCSDDPSSLGVDLIGSEYINVKTYDSINDTINQNSSYFKNVIPLGSADWILIGRYQNQNIQASSLLNFIFILPDTLKTYVLEDSINVLDSWIDLYQRYTYVDSSATMNFTVHKVNSYWSSATFTIDSLPTLQYEANDVSSDFSINDSMYSFHLDNSLILSWLINSADNTLEKNFGIYIDPTASSNKVLGFQALTSTSTDPAQLTVVIEKPGSFVDTISGYVNADVSMVDGEVPSLPAGLMCVQSSITIDSKLKFDLGVLPPGVVINKAELFITYDSPNSVKGSITNNTLKVYYLSGDDSITTEGSALTLLFSNNQYSGDISPFIRTWLGRNENHGMLVEAGGSETGLDLFALKGSDYSDISERPRLRISYTQKMNQ